MSHNPDFDSEDDEILFYMMMDEDARRHGQGPSNGPGGGRCLALAAILGVLILLLA